ncbi:MAG TPA: antitoxin VbhA family protein [Thiopseudomonas sp.]|nr:antitoxin VbhA family protein [Thiopseudomonas sp.]
MKYTKTQLLAFKVRQAVGSMAIEGMQVSKQSETTMLEVAAGRVSGKSVREQLVAKYKQASSAS